MKVSIIVPVHNAEETLRRCIDSIVEQEYKNIECILIENGSNDQSKNICLEYAMKYRNVVAISIAESGVSYARNRGLDFATGEIIGFCDADDFIEVEAINKIVEEFNNDSNIIAVFGAFYIGTSNQNGFQKKYMGLKNQKISHRKALELTLIDDKVMGSVWNKYYRASVLTNQQFSPKLSFCEDMHFNANVLSKVSKEAYVKII